MCRGTGLITYGLSWVDERVDTIDRDLSAAESQHGHLLATAKLRIGRRLGESRKEES